MDETLKNRWNLFADFCKAELATGGPDPQMPLIEELAKEEEDDQIRVWLAGCYGAHHCVASAYAVWGSWDPISVINDYPEFVKWLNNFWLNLPVRPEMRSHRMVEKRATCLWDFANFALGQSWRNWTNYHDMWEGTIQNIRYYNRYMAIKMGEMLRRLVIPHIVLRDMRAKGAWSPRRTLGMLWPEHTYRLNDRDNNDSETIELVENIAARTRNRLMTDYNISVSFFQLQVLLCEFREATVGGYYPGASHDEEMDYMDKAGYSFDMTPIYDARAKLFPHEYLGEKNNWHGLRKEKFQVFKGSV